MEQILIESSEIAEGVQLFCSGEINKSFPYRFINSIDQKNNSYPYYVGDWPACPTFVQTKQKVSYKNIYENNISVNLDIVWTEYRLVSLVYMRGRI